ncbi:mitochondrial cardiolipin synthase, putative [Plasmodium knowlesi strain H]|uniref:Mitochondrial cardiolipin synthase, putative n=3 Tax=Plasmodium knowlesi TaxID=5850 RepID=A0A5K1UUN9_PLAKH|nr:mitochondrial cardiolipin synthase, putative [Plasmodium knowlesi strain H]OTN64669.1 putative Cardiolipin synthetase [Plasmodium knowlesi]CAA9989234.1 mitochondrial cardiolipin synthase, putative [Plasmodium knowlesi strain H]SBO26207.1 mitochondrial cardiolipin synthase, putative [Plasmodium knowlesi strain H]SBO27115.1 mitochondrial cardiolipin synthase, putative [Plasmodium knowlesi strain H]VVS78708.1 mitochondrial cardiolipin synthase, putative [Plasmodium knowlesi strain H]|eukprot:XP_002261580.1 cardiolipin synthetase, putative [Plasmodium knowlesi strain H]
MSSCGCYILAEVGGGLLGKEVVGGKTVVGGGSGRKTVGGTSPPQEALLNAQRDLKGNVYRTIRKKVDPQIMSGTEDEGTEGGQNKKEIDIERLVEDNVEQLSLNRKEKDIMKKKWKYILKKNKEKYGKVSDGNKIKIYNDGHTTFRDILRSIEKSKKRVWFESYIFDDSELAQQVVDSLCNAAKRGCDVILLVDYIGSLKIKNKWVNMLKENNVHVLFFNTFLNSFLNMLPIFFRDHRKIIIVDNAAYCGSMNVSESVVPSGVGWQRGDVGEMESDVGEVESDVGEMETDVGEMERDTEEAETKEPANETYGGTSTCEGIMPNRCEHPGPSEKHVKVSEKKNKSKLLQYYDLHIKVKGPAVKDLADVFIDSLKMTKTSIIRGTIEEQKRYVDDEGKSCFVQVLESNVLRKIRSIQSTFEWVLKNGATKNIYITTSYFIPPGFLRRALFSALNNGVDISFLLSGNSDVMGDVPATYHIVKKFLRRSQRGGANSGGNNQHNHEHHHEHHLHNHGNSDNRDGSNQTDQTDGREGSHNNEQSDHPQQGKANSYLHNLRKRAESRIGENFLKRQNKGNCDFYFFQNRHCHAKNLMVDNLWCAVGSYNWDRFSSRRNLEVMVSIFDKQICHQFVQEHKSKIKNESKQVTLAQVINRNVFQGFFSYCAYHMAKWSGKNILDGLSKDSKKTVLRRAIVNKYLSDNCMENISLNMMWGA